MKLKTILLILCMSLILIGGVNANDLVFKKDSSVDLKVGCFDTNSDICSGACSLSVLYPNGSIFVDSQTMALSGNFFSYHLSNSSLNGEYKAMANCSNVLGTAGYTNFNFFINEQGNNPTQSQSIIYFVILAIIMIVIILCAVGMFATKNEYFKVGLFGIGYLFLVWLFAMIQDISSAFLYYSFLNSFSTIIFKVLMMGIFPMLIYVLAMIIYKVVTDKQIAQLAKRGIRK